MINLLILIGVILGVFVLTTILVKIILVGWVMVTYIRTRRHHLVVTSKRREP